MLSRYKNLIHRKETFRILRFLMVGISGTLVDFGLLLILKSFLHIPLFYANPISYSAGILNNFTFNRIWTFNDKKKDSIFYQFGKFVVVSVSGLMINTFLVVFLETPIQEMIHNPQYGYLLAKVIATLFTVIWNYGANRIWTFR